MVDEPTVSTRPQNADAAVRSASEYEVEWRDGRSRGFFIGSGVIEAGCKTIIGTRCKQSGMFWGLPGAENILALRCISTSRRLSDFWKTRLNAHSARNDCLALAA